MKVTVWSLTVEYYDVLDTSVHTSPGKAWKHLREWFHAKHDQLEGLEMTQDELDALENGEFAELLENYSVSNYIGEHELEF